MQRFPVRDAKYAYSAATLEWDGRAGRAVEVECVEGFGNAFASPADFSAEAYAAAEPLDGAVTGPISVTGAEAGGAVAVTIHSVEVVDAGCRRLRQLHPRTIR